MNTTSISNLAEWIGFPFRDPDWQRKLGIALLWGLVAAFIPILPVLALAGYGARLARRILEAGEQELPLLPEWDDFGDLILDGLRLAAAVLTLVLPLVILVAALVGSFLVPVYATSSNSEPTALAVALMLLLGLGLILLALALSVAQTLFMPAAVVHVAARRSYPAVFAVREWMKIWSANPGGFLVSVLLSMLVSGVLAMGVAWVGASVVLTCLAPLLAGAMSAVTMLVQSMLWARAYRMGKDRLNRAPVPPPSPSEPPEPAPPVEEPAAPEAIDPVEGAAPEPPEA
jgi:hypothetical protein